MFSERQLRIALTIVGILMTDALSAAEYYVATDGNDSNPGTIDQPFASLARGQEAASPGDTVWIRGGEYYFTAGLGAGPVVNAFTKSGLPGKRINYWAYPGETPIFDFYNYLPLERIRGFSVQADWLHFRGLELRGVQQTITDVNESWAIRVEEPLGSGSGDGGDHNIFERLNLHHNEGPGLFILHGGNNLVLNCDSHHNWDPDRGGENADGFGSHSRDDGNVFDGNRAWDNSDDGFDFINSPGTVTVRNSWAWRNGFIPDTNIAAGNGSGFKAGGFRGNLPPPDEIPRNLLEGNLAFANRVWGFNSNGHQGGMDWLNNTAFGNPRGFDLWNERGDDDAYLADHFLRNNIAYHNTDDVFRANQSLIDDEFNTWNAGFGVSNVDFLSLSMTGVDGPRQPDGSLPDIDFLKLAATSGLINAGQNVGLPFSGAAPDLGAFESGLLGDYNADGRVDAGDYVYWRNRLGNGFFIADYGVWRDRYGVGGGGGGIGIAAPEPAVVVLLVLGLAVIPARRRRPAGSRCRSAA